MAQYTLNLNNASIVFPEFPECTITAPCLTREGMYELSPITDPASVAALAYGAITVLEMSQLVTVTFEIVKTHPLSNTFRSKIQNSAIFGQAEFKSLAANHEATIKDMVCTSTPTFTEDGNSKGLRFVLTGWVPVNTGL